MSIKRLSTYSPQPIGVRASPTQLSVDHKGERIIYTSGKSVFIRSIDDPANGIQYTGHTANANVARFSPSGFYVASGDASGKIRVWDCAGEDLNTKGEFPIISGPIKDLAWDGESKRIIAVGEGKERFGAAITFDTGNSVGEVTGQSSVINSVSIRQQRPYRAATASDDQTIVFYHGAPFKFNTLHKGLHTGFVHGVAFSPDGEHFVSVGADRKIFLFDGKTGELVSEIKDADSHHRGSILAVSWSPDSKQFATASTDQSVKVWDVSSKSVVKTWRFGPEGSPSVPDHQVGVVWTPRANGLIISLSLSGDLNYIDPASDTPTRTVSGHQGTITALATGPSNTIVTGSFDGRICRWTSDGTATAIDGTSHTNSVIGFAASDKSILSAGWDDTIRSLDPSAAAFTSSPIPTDSQPKGIATLDSSTVVLTANDLRIYPAGSSTPTVTEKLSFTPTALAVAPAISHIAVAGQDSKLRIFTYSSSGVKLVNTLAASRTAPTSLSYSTSGQYFAVGEQSGKIVLYETQSSGEYAVKTTRWAFHNARVESIAWNSAGTHVVSGSLDCSLYVYSVDRPVKNAVFRNAHQGGINGVAWEDEKTVVSAGADGAVKRWEVELP
ncbi:WD repeat-containing protein-like protein 1 [Ascodesmis nigricans]|uniref:WD repeat-containing protein-like protein 1 n=1 Tax=Ascodesmis nigricans TaxID=341454 RepID=A0A4S2N5N2_9PEZI|nr:WD repeat-containing protein-like protein 1 [Ascodesmis nigricans]